MSYILEALKRSQQERGLGQVPTLADAPYLEARQPTRLNPWLAAALLLAVTALAIALYAVLNTRQPLPSGALPAVVPGAERTPAIAHVPPSAAQWIPAPVEAPSPAPVREGHGVQSGAPGPASPRPRPAAPRHREPRAPIPPLPEEIPTAPLPSAAADSGGIPQDLAAEVEKFKQRVLREQRERKTRAKVRPPMPDPVPPPTAPLVTEVPPPPAGLEALPQELQSQLPARRLTVHVYAKTPAQRFVILNSRRLREGERTPEGLLLVAVRPDGVVLEFAGHRFFQQR